MTPEEISALVLRAREGDEEAHRALLEKWRPLLERLARRFHGKADVEDALSAAYAGYLEAVRTFDAEKGDWKQWLSQKAVSLIRDESIKAEGVKGREVNCEVESSASAEAEASVVLRSFLRTLTFRDRRILSLSARGLSAREIARKLGTNHDYVAKRLLLIRARFFLFTGEWH